jgi:CheY-like chemotaxis protein
MSHISQGEKILIVEDNDFVRMQMASYLQDEGYKVVEAANGAEALKMMTADLKLIVVDVRMAPVDGFELIKAVRGRNPTLPLILVTGDQNPDLLNEASKWSVSAVLMKPVPRERLISMVNRAVTKVKK